MHSKVPKPYTLNPKVRAPSWKTSRLALGATVALWLATAATPDPATQ